MDESDDDMVDNEDTKKNVDEEEEEDDEIIESDIELEGDIVEPDNDPPQKVCLWKFLFILFYFFKSEFCFYVLNA